MSSDNLNDGKDINVSKESVPQDVEMDGESFFFYKHTQVGEREHTWKWMVNLSCGRKCCDDGQEL